MDQRSLVNNGSTPAATSEVVTTTEDGGMTVAFTFDDGPHPTYTPQMLDLLARYGIQATFCLIGEQVQAYPDLVRRIDAEGHELGDHTMTHPDLTTISHEAGYAEVMDTYSLIVNTTGRDIAYFRAPYGHWTEYTNTVAAVQGGMQPIGWAVDTNDWQRPGVQAIVDAVRNDPATQGGIVLMHDGGGDRSQTVEAVNQLIPYLLDQGYTFDSPLYK
ncbi:polysaccharide deacetylase family protein [Saccharopolyspora pogona]|uniref:polysaccharide deacetylase family protein n=1 Tax=Saccharopolyspora pogona TaxID=333966 RepID=UPI0016866A19|nr:polysaccharide deacetylase family protein [Saccharopolyspora pogona]